MKVIIAGSRNVTAYGEVETAMCRALAEWAGPGVVVEEIVSGGALGVDALGEEWARRHGIAVRRCPADWAKHGLKAGPLRNREMATYAHALVAVWDGASRGTGSMILEARRRLLLVYVHRVSKPPEGE